MASSSWIEAFSRAVEENKVLILAGGNVTLASLAVYFWAKSRGGVVKTIKDLMYAAASVTPGVSGALDAELEKLMADVEHDVVGDRSGKLRVTTLPDAGLTRDALLEHVEARSREDSERWAAGRVSGAVYHGGEELSRIIAETYARFALSNPLHPDVFPGTRQMEAEVVSMVVDLFHGGESGCGTTTSGGTESILLACKAYRDWARHTRGIETPEIVAPVTAHAAFDKAAGYFGMRLVKVPVDPETFQADVAAMEAAITRDTCMVVGSAITYPHGVCDPIEELAAIAAARGIPMHVDSCLGSFLVPMAHAVGHPFPVTDFRVPGVTSISVDTHKFGFAPKGTSTILYRSPEWRKYQYFKVFDWPGGIYASPTIAGSRPGAVIACTWSVMMYLGKDGYRAAASGILDAARTIIDGIGRIPGLAVAGVPALSTIAFRTSGDEHGAGIDIYKVATAMSKRGWSINPLQNPASVHICVTHNNAPQAAQFVSDLEEALAAVRDRPDEFRGGAASIYGSAAVAPDALKEELAAGFLDCLFKA